MCVGTGSWYIRLRIRVAAFCLRISNNWEFVTCLLASTTSNPSTNKKKVIIISESYIEKNVVAAMSSWVAVDGDSKGCFGLCRERSQQGPTGDRHPPGDHPAVKEIDTLIAREMFQMSIEEREKALDDVHGVVKAEREDPNFLNNRLMQLEKHIHEMKHGTVYEEAEQLSQTFVRDRHFRTKFLRAEQFEPYKAAQRMLRFFECKKELFGRDKLVKEITMEDLDEDDMEALRSGDGQISPFRDACGRPIITFAQKLRKYKHIDNVVRSPHNQRKKCYDFDCWYVMVSSFSPHPSFNTYCRNEPHITCIWLSWNLQRHNIKVLWLSFIKWIHRGQCLSIRHCVAPFP